MSLKLHLQRHLDVTVMELSGRVTLGEGSSSYRDALREAVWNGHRKLALDYGEISYQDSSGNGEMVSAFTIVANAGGDLVLFDLTKRVKDLLQITKLYTVFRVFDSRDSALAYFDSTRKQDVQLTESRFFHVSVVLIEGSLTESTGASRVPAAIKKALDSGLESVILLCPQVLDIDRAGAESLKAARRDVRARGGDLVLAGVEERLLPAIQRAGAADEIRRYETVDAALREFGLGRDVTRGIFTVKRAS